MLEILQFIFRDFITWFGMLILICGPLAILADGFSGWFSTYNDYQPVKEEKNENN